MSLKDLITPFYVWKRAFEKPFTNTKPLETRPGAPRYRGFHKNDIDKCIGCGTCEEICQNCSIDLVPVKGIHTKDGDSGLRPRIDYGRCCWCALCVDICPTGSLTMSNEYTWVEDGRNNSETSFIYTPGVDKKSWDDSDFGYSRPNDYELLTYKKEEMDMDSPEKRVKTFLEIVHGYSKEQAQKEADRCIQCGICIATCPAHMNIPGYIKAIREDNLEEALQILYKTNPFSSSCGRVCTHKCEEVCALEHNGEAISIRWLKRYIVDSIDNEKYLKILKDEFKPNGKKVAIIGAGPGGLTAAYYLIKLGYSVTVLEAKEKAGGMLRYGIPEYRLPYPELDKDIDYITSLGVKIEFNSRVGKNVRFERLIKDYDAIFFSIGLNEPYKIGVEGEKLDGVISALELLEDVTNGKKVNLGSKVAVIGGGNAAMDAARTARRLGSEVTVIYRRRMEDMPADQEEIDEAMEEKVKFIIKAIPVKIEKSNSKLKFIWNNAKMQDSKDGGRPKPIAIEGDIDFIEVDTVISAIGQGGEYSLFPKNYDEKIKLKWNKVLVDNDGQTSVPKVFAGGDIVNYTADAISAIADGHKAAKGIDKVLRQ